MATAVAGHPRSLSLGFPGNVFHVPGLTDMIAGERLKSIAQDALQSLLKDPIKFVRATKATEDDEAKFSRLFLDTRIRTQTGDEIDNTTETPSISQARKRTSPEGINVPPGRSPKVRLTLGMLHCYANRIITNHRDHEYLARGSGIA